ncbi:MAG: hypothetical protein WBB76_05810 [Gaiellaceae bacterium]
MKAGRRLGALGRRHSRPFLTAGFALVVSASLCAALPASASRYRAVHIQRGAKVRRPVHQDVSRPLRDLAPVHQRKGRHLMKEHELPPLPRHSGRSDPVIQRGMAGALAPTAGSSFEGVGAGLAGFQVNSAPPDTNGDVGPNHYFQIVNTGFAIFSKSGSVLYGPAATNTLWRGFGGGCETNNDGDATVKYDRLADRWIVSQFSISTTPYLQCVAVSTSGDPTGSYYRYSFSYGNVAFPDYPKLGVWPDAYYTTYNIFNYGATFAGAKVCAFDRASMLTGGVATQQCFDTDSTHGGLLPSDLDGATAPPAGSPNYVLEFGTNSLNMWRFHVDWASPASSTFAGPISISVPGFTAACNGGGTCIRQPSTTNRLDSLADRLMYRLEYRNFGDHESLVVNHSVTAGTSVGIRWYELRNPGGTPQVYQASTYAPDSTYRWMGSAAMDGSGDIALGYSASSSLTRPSIRYTGRLAGDPLNTLGAEATMLTGTGSQTGGLHRWGDYSSISVDPSDDCTFWYTNEYLRSNGSFNWHTRIGSFKFAGCSGTPPPPPAPGFSISATPTSRTVGPGAATTTYTVNTTAIGGSTETVGLSAAGAPAGTTLTLSPTSVTAGGSSTLTADVGASTAPGSYTLTVTGTGTSGSHPAQVTLNVAAPNPVVNGGFESGLTGWTASGVVLPTVVSGGHSGSYSAQLGRSTAFNGDSTLKQTITVPVGSPTLTYWYNPHCPDTITYDQQSVQIRSTGGTVLATVMNICSNSGVWTQKTFSMAAYAGQTVVLYFNVHDDNWPTDPTYMLLDDVSVQ